MAQERPLDNREKEAVGLNAPVEGLSVSGPGKYYPSEYSAQISAYNRQTELMSRIPESLAKIIEYADDYKITAYNNKEQSELYRKGLENELYKNTLMIDSANRVNDKSLRLQEALINAKRKAEESNGDIFLTEAYKEVFDSEEFRNPVEFTSLNSQSDWQKVYKGMQQAYTKEAMETDIFNVRAEMDMNIGHAIDMIHRQATDEGVYPVASMDKFTQTTFLYRKHTTAKNLREFNQRAWESFVVAYANNILGRVDMYLQTPNAPGAISAEDAETALRALLSDTAYKKFVYLDKDGNPEKDADGQDATFTVSLSDAVQDKLLGQIKSLKNKEGTGKGDTDLAGYYKKLLNEFGLPDDFEIDKPGEIKDVFKGLLGKDKKTLMQMMHNFMQYTANSPASASSKASYMRKGVNLMAFVDTVGAARDLMINKGNDPAAIKNSLALLGQNIDNGLRSGKDLSALGLQTRVGDFTFESSLQAFSSMYGIPDKVDGFLTSRQYFENVSTALKTLSGMDSDDLLSYLNPNLYAAVNTIGVLDGQGNIVKTVTAQDILKDEGTGIPRINQESVDILAADMKQAAQLTGVLGGKGLSEEFIKIRVSNLNIDTPLKAAAFAKAAQQAGTTGSIERFAAKHLVAGSDDKYYSVSQNMLKGLLLTSNADLEKELSEYYAQSPSESMRKQEFEQFSKGPNKVAVESMQLTLDRNKIPGVFRPAMQSLAQDMLMAYSRKGENKGQVVKHIESLIKDNFTEFDHIYNNQLVYKNSAALQNWQGEDLNSYFNFIHNDVKKRIGTDVEFLPDADLGTFVVTRGGEPLRVGDKKIYIHTAQELGIPVNSSRSASFIRNTVCMEVLGRYALSDKKLSDKMMGKIDSLKMFASRPHASVEELENDFRRYWVGITSSLNNTSKLKQIAKRYVERGYDDYYHKIRITELPGVSMSADVSGLLKGEKSLFGGNSFVQVKAGMNKTKNPYDVVAIPRLEKFYSNWNRANNGATQNVYRYNAEVFGEVLFPDLGREDRTIRKEMTEESEY